MREEILNRMSQDPDARPELLPVAAKELQRRLKRTGLALPPRTRSRTDKWPKTRAIPVLRREASPVEMMIVRAIARTWGAAQFGCSPSGAVFTADTDGYSMLSGRRNEVTSLSPLLVEVAEIFNEWRRDGVGGRFYERDGCFFDADDGAIFLEVEMRDNSGAKSLWQRIFRWTGG